MTRGFYTLSSSMLSQTRTLNTIANNMANAKTNGFKKDVMTSTTFGEMVMNRIDGGNSMLPFDNGRTPLGSVSMMRTVDEAVKIHSQGMYIESDRDLDFSIMGEGFFKVKDGENMVYTRNGSFNLDNEGYLILEGVGRVQGEEGDILVQTDRFETDGAGNLLDADREIIATIPAYTFENYNDLLTVGAGMFGGPGTENPVLVENPDIRSRRLEGSNVDISQEMTNTISTQRILQNVSQAIKMYDATLQSATTQIGRI